MKTIETRPHKIKMPLSPLDAINEKDEDEITETIKNPSTRKEKVIPLPDTYDSPSLARNAELVSVQIKESSIQSNGPKVTVLSPVLSVKNPSRNVNSNSISDITQANSCLSMNTKDNLIIIPETAIYFTKNDTYSIFKEAFNYFSSYYLQSTSPFGKKVKRNKGKAKGNYLCCLTRLIMKQMSRYRLHKDLRSDQRLLHFIAKTLFDINNNLHWKMALSLYYSFSEATIDMSCRSSNHSPQKEGTEWSALFNSISPVFPLDKGGIHILLQMLWLIENYPSYFKELTQFLFNEKLNRHYIVDLLSSISQLCLEYVNNNELTVYFNQRQNYFDTLFDFYTGFIFQTHLFLQVESKVPMTCERIANALEKAKKEANQTPSSIFWKCKQFKELYPNEMSSPLLTKSCAESSYRK